MKFKKVLIIAHGFPPLGGPGSIRYLQFARFLPKFGWKPYILTVRNPSKLLPRDHSLKVPKNLKIYRAVSFPSFILWKIIAYFIGRKNANFFFFPDRFSGWIVNPILKGYHIIRKEKIDLIFNGCSPYTSLIIGYILKKLTKKPLVLDFRDPYAENRMNVYPHRIYKYLHKKMEQKFLQTADAAITTTNSFKNFFPHQEKFTIIANGYFDLLNRKETPIKRYEKFTISIVGTLYSARTWGNFIKALKQFQDKIHPKAFQVLFIGYNHKKLIDPIAKKYNINNLIRYLGYISNEECNLTVKKSHLLVTALPSGKNSALVIKIFSYLHSDSPILGIMNPSSETAQFIKKSNIGIVVENKTQEIVNGLIRLFKGEQFERNWEYIKLYNRETLTEKLVNYLNKILEENFGKNY